MADKFYDGQTGRWLKADPISEEATLSIARSLDSNLHGGPVAGQTINEGDAVEYTVDSFKGRTTFYGIVKRTASNATRFVTIERYEIADNGNVVTGIVDMVLPVYIKQINKLPSAKALVDDSISRIFGINARTK